MAHVTRTLWEAVDYELQRLPEGARLARRLAPLAEQTAAKAAFSLSGASSPLSLLGYLGERLLTELPAESDRKVFRHASEEASAYLELNGRPVMQPLPTPPTPDLSAPRAHAGYADDVASVPVDQVCFPGVAHYVSSRLGPAAALIDQLGVRDHIRFSNQPVERSLEGLPPLTRAEHLNLPVSSWNKTVQLLHHADGSRTLLLADFPGHGMLAHFQLLTRHRLQDRPDGPSVSTVEEAAGYESTRQGLARLFRAQPQALRGVDALVVGYEGAFRREWAKEREAAVRDPASPWTAEVYRLPSGRKVAVLSTSSSFHGEILGENLRRVVLENPGIRAVYAGGSAGSLHAREPYSVVFPDRLEGQQGARVSNVLSSGTGGGVHRSAISVMEETPALLSTMRTEQVTTVDMEMGPLADALADLGVEVGVGMLVTDFPAGAVGGIPIELSRQDTSQKYRHIDDFPTAVSTHLQRREPVWVHPLEAAVGRSLHALSAENMAREQAWVGPMTAAETRFFERVRGLEPTWSFRMSAARLRRVLEDGVILSTAQVAALKGTSVKPYTPAVEDQLYGAFDYVFGAVGVGRGSDEYGEVRVVLRPETVETRSFATYRSGWRALKSVQGETGEGGLDNEHADAALLTAARKRLSEWVVTPQHYQESMALFAVEQARKLGPEVLSALLAATDAEFPALLERQGLGFLEGRIRGSLNLEDVALVELPSTAPADLVGLVDERGLRRQASPAAR